MSKQISLFMTAKDEENLLQFIKENEDVLLNEDGDKISSLGKPVVYVPGKPLNKSIIRKAYIAAPDAFVTKDESGFFEEEISEVIEYLRSSYKNDNQLWNGRLYLVTSYYDNNDQIVKKPDWLIKKYEVYKKWVTKHFRKSSGTAFYFYIGDDAYRLYKEKKIVLKNSPKSEIHFD